MNETILSLGDHHLRAIEWSESGDDFIVATIAPDGARRRIRFRWAIEVRIEMAFGSYAGMPLIYEARTSNGGLQTVEIDFGAAPEGRISLKCEEVVHE